MFLPSLFFQLPLFTRTHTHTLSLSISLFSFFSYFLLLFLSRFHASVRLPSSTPLEMTFSLCFLFYLYCPFPFFVCASFLETISSYPLLKSNFLPLLAVWLFCSPCLIFIFSCLAFPSLFVSLFLSHLSFHLWCFSSLFFFRLFFVKLCCVCCFGFRLWHRKRCFPCHSGVFGGLLENQFGSGCSASLSWGCGVCKNKELNNGTRVFQLRVRCVCLLIATDKLRKGRRLGQKHCKNRGFGGIWLL